MISFFNLVEIYYYALREWPEKADSIFLSFRKAVVEVDDETLKAAVKFRKSMNKRQLSYADCIGYIYAKRYGMKFLTGDPEFEHLDNVEFVQ